MNEKDIKETLGDIAQRKWDVMVVLTAEQDRIIGEIASLREDETILGDNATAILTLLDKLASITREVLELRADYEMVWADRILEFELR